MRLFKKIIYRGKMQLVTGIHIGDSKEKVEIGGVDSPVVRRKDNNEPYIPGSSMKGKIRSLLEISYGEANTFKKPDHIIGKLFGALPYNPKREEDTSNEPDHNTERSFDDAPRNGQLQGNPSRLIVRDAYLTRESAKKLYESEFTDMPYSEIKFENQIDRIIGSAKHPRQIERVPAGAEFEVEFVINVIGENQQEADKNEKDFIELLKRGITLLEHDYLGGSGSRGYGQVKFDLDWSKPTVVDVQQLISQS